MNILPTYRSFAVEYRYHLSLLNNIKKLIRIIVKLNHNILRIGICFVNLKQRKKCQVYERI